MTLEQEIISFVSRATNGDAAELTEDTSLVASGRLQSLQILELIEFVEARFSIQLATEDMRPDHFETVGAVARLVRLRVSEKTTSEY